MTLNETRWTVLTEPYQKEYSDLMDLAFGLEKGVHYLDDFPIWNPSIAYDANRYQITGWRGNRLIATASIRFAKYKWLSGDETPFGFIGAVATHPEFARRGLASEAIDLLLHEGLRRKVEVFALWGSESTLYQRKGFRFGGRQARVPLRELPLRDPGLRGFDILSGYDPEVVSVLRQRDSGIQYSAIDRDWIARQKNVQWRTLWKDGRCLAFVAFNRGIDLTNMVHEAEGRNDAVIALLSSLRSEMPDLELLLHPSRVSSLCAQEAALPTVENLAQFRIQPNALFTDVDLQSLWFSGLDSC